MLLPLFIFSAVESASWFAFSRAAFSPVIAEADDRADGIYDRHTGALIAQGDFGLPVFVGTMQSSTRELIRLIREGRAGAPAGPVVATAVEFG